MTLIIARPHSQMAGGVNAYCETIGKYLKQDFIFYKVGALRNGESFLERSRHLFSDCVRFDRLLRENGAGQDIVHLNPSFLSGALLRDGLLLLIAKKHKKNVVVFFHGWSDRVSRALEKHSLKAFLSVFGKADAFVVLAEEYRKRLRRWGLQQPIYLETTAVDDNLLEGFSWSERLSRIESNGSINLLFLARVEKEKGIFETIECLNLLSKRLKTLNIQLIVAGSGTAMNEAQQMVAKLGLGDAVSFHGFVSDRKGRLFRESDIYILPSYREGMPTSVLEAMAFGLPVVSRPVGGIRDFFVEGEHGYLSESLNPSIFADLVQKVVVNKEIWRKMAISACEYAQNRFVASRVAKRIAKVYSLTLRD